MVPTTNVSSLSWERFQVVDTGVVTTQRKGTFGFIIIVVVVGTCGFRGKTWTAQLATSHTAYTGCSWTTIARALGYVLAQGSTLR